MFDWFTINSTQEWILLAALGVLLVYQLVFYERYIAAPRRAENRRKLSTENQSMQVAMESDGQLDLFSNGVQGVSVIVCAKNEQTNLEDYLPLLLEQDYPMYEVIVVNDGSEDETQYVVERYQRLYRHLRYTFVPKYARVRSTKKLAITLGIKAAHYDHLLLTDADCRPNSNQWIRHMMDSCSEEMVLGYGAYFQEPTMVNRWIQYDTLFNGMQYLGMAIHHHPYMGVGRNLMYTKDLFMRNNGFAGLLNYMSGDDDLFVNKVATSTNTTVVCRQESITWSSPKHSWSEWIMQKRRHLSVSPHYHLSSQCRLGLEPVTRGLWYGLILMTALSGNPAVSLVALGLWLLRWITQVVIINRASHLVGGPRWGLDIVMYDIGLPLISLWLLLTTHPRKNQVW